MGENNIDRMKAAQEQLVQASHKLAEAMYQAASSQTPPQDGADAQSGGASSEPKKDDVVDAEFVDVDENKK